MEDRRILVQTYHSPCGDLLLGSMGERLCLCNWAIEKHPGRVDRRLQTLLSARYEEGSSDIIREAARQLDEYFGLERREFELPLLFKPEIFDNVVCGHEAKEDKPFGGHLTWTVKDILRADEITPATVWVIGDSPQDSACALNAGARPIRIGKSIWGDEEQQSADICFFDSFVDFYQSLLLSNPK